MMKRVIVSALIVSMFGSFSAMAQKKKGAETNKYLEYNYEKKNVKERKVVPYPPLREADVVYAKRIERVIDVREKKNLVMNWPKNPLNRVIYKLVTEGEDKSAGKLKAYRTDSLDKPMNVGEVKKIGGYCEIISVPIDPSDPYITKDTQVCNPFEYEQIVRWQINEEWIFDKQSGMFFPRIISLAPLYVPNINGTTFPETPMFYIRYADLRPIFVQEEVFNRQNDAQRMTYYDYFESRMFSSYITKESNDKDLAINQMPEFKDAPMEALYESERVKEELFNWEHDLWEY